MFRSSVTASRMRRPLQRISNVHGAKPCAISIPDFAAILAIGVDCVHDLVEFVRATNSPLAFDQP